MDWDDLEEQRGKYDDTYLNELAAAIHAAVGDGLEVIVTVSGPPR